MEIKITHELLADLKDKAQKIKFDTWHVLRPRNSDGCGYCVIGDTLGEIIARIKGNGTIIKGEYVGPRNMIPRNAEYIAAANPAVILALIAKIEEQNRILEMFEDDLK